MTLKLQALQLDQMQLQQLCTSSTWVNNMLKRSPFVSYAQLCQCAEISFNNLNEDDWLEAFAGHPMIGDLKTLQEKYAQGKSLSEIEQSLVSDALPSVLSELLKFNLDYQHKFGFIFIVCASHKTAAEMLSLLKARYVNTRDVELKNAQIEQQKISSIRMEAYR
ncbi:2-oxo-4-hydroxy-4-carboxy-5-ureidoimidazoline decarboxylase [Alginatibacterium sediminis]|uniref:2-oxo-4-hydroxy-4-carboxy-5-ureidoimidazoline decarboxylase n=1 Tax=Alginatibacterium sediminis TaxID=2164068 RepID=A0A420EH51_9ALTE|nr:2-oxo-4-hydroxy-4-carboxy-5-ureidoimidazoline decarboxylase [Alginatibacterium sediminis]RKF19886.1 2-oxo-4-hydroxy-4-carboxy-5-ureidoimidazoline decarboxylase [Alginatibacterium sediminis]